MHTKTKLSGVAAAVGALALGALFVPASSADGDPPPIAVELLTPRSEFTDDVSGQIRLKLDGQATNSLNMADMSRVATAKITVQPGARFPWHTQSRPGHRQRGARSTHLHLRQRLRRASVSCGHAVHRPWPRQRAHRVQPHERGDRRVRAVL